MGLLVASACLLPEDINKHLYVKNLKAGPQIPNRVSSEDCGMIVYKGIKQKILSLSLQIYANYYVIYYLPKLSNSGAKVHLM